MKLLTRLGHLIEEEGALHVAGASIDPDNVLTPPQERKLLFLLDFLLPLGAWLATRAMLLRQGDARAGKRNLELTAHALSAPLLFSRSLVLVLRKRL